MMTSGLDGLSGSFVPLVVPFDDGAIDYDAYARLCDWQITQGSSGLLVNATSGEPTTLTLEERAKLVETAMNAAAGRRPVCAGTASVSHAETAALIERFEKLDVDYVFVVTPFYCKPPQRALVDFFADVAARTEKSLLAYHIPGRAAVSLTADTLAEIKDRATNFVGLKNTDDDMALVTDTLVRLGGDFRIFCGMEKASLPTLAVGGAGLMISISNVIPDRVARLCRFCAEGDTEGAKNLNKQLAPLFDAIGYDTAPITTKYMLKRIGMIAKNEHRLPMTTSTPALEARLDAVLQVAGLI
ncbi:MAG: 4-hydroxy-tetrahydrodipicolinate synthase [Candidatus Binatia bacterium]